MMAQLLALCLLAASPTAGTAGFDFLRVSPTAREAAMGGAVVGASEGPMSFWYSPARIASDRQSAQLCYTGYLAGIQAGALGYSRPVSQQAGVGLGLAFTTAGTMKRTNEFGEQLGTFGTTFVGLNLSGAYRISDAISAGLALQGLYGSIDTFFSLGLAASAGAVAQLPVEGLAVGVALRNAGYELKPYRSSRDPLPLDIGFGLGYRPAPVLALAADIHKPIDNRVNFAFGIEGAVGEYLLLRGGYSSLGLDLQTGGSTDLLAGISLGLGVRYRGLQLDYAFTPLLPLGITHRVSLAFNEI